MIKKIKLNGYRTIESLEKERATYKERVAFILPNREGNLNERK
jgi:hypothetical protein